jgi:tripartite-type tricarboxylate transporter receptor subunit TctC
LCAKWRARKHCRPETDTQNWPVAANNSENYASETALIGALKDPDLVKRFREISTEPMPADKATPEAAQRTLTSEIDRWAPIIKAAGEYAD